VFLGYSNLHKGYKCLDVSTGRIYIPWDIVFDETVFPFASLHSNAGDRLRAEIDLLPRSLQPIYSMPTDFNSSLVSIFNRLNTLETHTVCLNNCYSTLRQYFDYVPTNSEPSSWYPTVRIIISGETFHARCDTMSEFCLMPKDVYESLIL
jgi:hypothetical protein